MGISFIDNVDYRGPKPNFTRDLFDTVDEMVAFSSNYLPPVFECNVAETGKRYRYVNTNSEDPVLGKWREVTGAPSWTGTIAEFEALDKSTLKAGTLVYITDDSSSGIIALENTVTSSLEVGGIPKGTTFAAGTTMEDILIQLLVGPTPVSDIYVGVLDTNTFTNFDDFTLSTSTVIDVDADSQYIVFAYEDTLGDLTRIEDMYGFDNTSNFTKTSQVVGGKTYNVYTINYKVTCTQFQYKLIF